MFLLQLYMTLFIFSHLVQIGVLFSIFFKLLFLWMIKNNFNVKMIKKLVYKIKMENLLNKNDILLIQLIYLRRKNDEEKLGFGIDCYELNLLTLVFILNYSFTFSLSLSPLVSSFFFARLLYFGLLNKKWIDWKIHIFIYILQTSVK